MRGRGARDTHGRRDDYRDDRRDGYHYDRRHEERDDWRRNDHRNQRVEYSNGGRESQYRERGDDNRDYRENRRKAGWPNQRDVEKFLYENGIDEAASQDFRGCPPDVQRMVMEQGSLLSANKPSGAMIIRIKKARLECGSVYTPHNGPSEREVEDFLYENGIDEAASNDFRGCPPDVQRMVMEQGSLTSAQKPSGAMIIRIKKARLECGSVYQPPKFSEPEPRGPPPPPRVNRHDTQNRRDHFNDRRFEDDRVNDRRDHFNDRRFEDNNFNDRRFADSRARSRTKSPIRRGRESHRAVPQVSHSITVEGIPDDMDAQELKDMVEEFGPSVTTTRTYRRGNTLCATVEFKELADAERVVAEMDQRLIEGEDGRLRAYF